MLTECSWKSKATVTFETLVLSVGVGGSWQQSSALPPPGPLVERSSWLLAFWYCSMQGHCREKFRSDELLHSVAVDKHHALERVASPRTMAVT